MFVIELTYKADLPESGAAMTAHVAWLNQFRANQRADDLPARVRDP